jgi:hypothetical protein
VELSVVEGGGAHEGLAEDHRENLRALLEGKGGMDALRGDEDDAAGAEALRSGFELDPEGARADKHPLGMLMPVRRDDRSVRRAHMEHVYREGGIGDPGLLSEDGRLFAHAHPIIAR